MKRLYRAAGVFLSLCVPLLFAGCAGEASGADRVGQDTDWQEERMQYDRRTSQDRRTEPEDERKVETVNLDDAAGEIVLTGSGDIRLFGSLDGSVTIDGAEDELVHLYLAGVSISSQRGPAITVQEASKVIVTLVSGTENVLTDSPDYTDPNGRIPYEETPACLYSFCDLTINGDGTLQVYGYYEDGIRSKDRIKLLGGTVSVQAKGDGIRGNDGILIQDASVDIQSEKNGMRTTNPGEDDRGVIEINGGTVSVVAGEKGIDTASDLYLYRCGCSVNAVEEKVRTEGTAYIAEGCLNE